MGTGAARLQDRATAGRVREERRRVSLFVQQILNGLTLGSVYSLVALGLTLVYGILRIPNFSHGALFTIGAYAAFLVSDAAKAITGNIAYVDAGYHVVA